MRFAMLANDVASKIVLPCVDLGAVRAVHLRPLRMRGFVTTKIVLPAEPMVAVRRDESIYARTRYRKKGAVKEH